MKKRQKKIQAVLLIIGVLLILLTYFYYPYMNKNKSLVEKNIQKNQSTLSDDASENTTLFEQLQYKGLYDLDKTFIVKSKKAHINDDEPDRVIMSEGIHVILYLKGNREVTIFADEGVYIKSTYDLFLNKNVRATDGEIKIFSDNLNLLGNESSAQVFNNVTIDYPTGSSLRADKIDFNFETKLFKISMFDDKQINMKVIK